MAFRIEVSREASFCPGVDRAFRITGETLFGGRSPVFSIGPLIHNPEVVKRLHALGLQVIEPDLSRLPELEGVPVVIRSHGIDTRTEEILKERGAVLIDATCPTVKRAQDAAAGLAREGRLVVVIGSASHPEVISIVGRADAPVTVLESVEDARKWLAGPGAGAGKVGVVCQTTISRRLFEEVTRLLESGLPDVEVRDTICESVTRRQAEALSIAGGVDVMLVVGGRDSSNTTHLASICSAAGVPTHHIEQPLEIEPEWLEGVSSVGVTGGASTPDWLIEETVERLEEMGGG